MKGWLKKRFFLRSIFSKLLASFFLVLCIMSLFNLFSYNSYIDIIEKEMTKNADERLNSVVSRLDTNFSQIKNTLLQIYLENDFSLALNSNEISDYYNKLLVNDISSYLSQNQFVREICVMSEKSRYILTSKGTYEREMFFNILNSNPVYNEEFWIKEMKEGVFSNSFYKAGDFTDNSMGNKVITRCLVPITFKKARNSNFIIIATIDIKAMVNFIDAKFMNDIYIYNSDKQLIFTLKPDFQTGSNIFGNYSGYTKEKDGYLFTRQSNDGDLIYRWLLPNAQLKLQMQKNSFILRLFIFISLLIGIVISLYIAKIFNNPVKQITEIIKRTENLYPLGDNISDLESIRDNIQKIVFHSSDYARQNNLLMEAFIYQAKIKDIYVHVREAKNQFDIKPHYALICFKIHFKAEFLKSELADTSKATFFLKELIGLNISKYFEESITFHIENNQIISTVNVNKNIRDIMPFVEEISEKLKSEEKFAFFTIAVSEIYNDVSELNKVYTRLFDILKRRKLIQKTQILPEKTINLKQNNFYFPMERVEQFLSLLRNAKKDECIQLLDKILEYNFKKEVDSFNIYLLCVELVSCCVKVLIKLYFNVPVSINIRDIYSNFEQCLAKEEYIAQCEEFVKTVIDYIDTHRKKNDYIIEYIQNYIEEHYAEDIYLGMFAERLNLTSAYISWYFKDKLGINQIDYLNDFRIKKAFEFMDNSQLKIKDIAQKVGISNTNTFTRLFKKYSGYTPMDYRKSRCE